MNLDTNNNETDRKFSITSNAGGDVFTVSETGDVAATSFIGDLTGNADTTDSWSTSRTVTFGGGDVTGNFSIDGSADVNNVNLQVINDSHTHDSRYYTETESDAKYLLNTTDSLTGDLDVTGTLTAAVKSFLIPHPTKENKKLQYGVLEGPEHSVYVRGKLDGDNKIVLPEYWKELVHEDRISVSLTPIGKNQNLWVEDVTSEYITIGSGFRTIKCFYHVFAERKDVERLKVEV